MQENKQQTTPEPSKHLSTQNRRSTKSKHRRCGDVAEFLLLHGYLALTLGLEGCEAGLGDTGEFFEGGQHGDDFLSKRLEVFAFMNSCVDRAGDALDERHQVQVLPSRRWWCTAQLSDFAAAPRCARRFRGMVVAVLLESAFESGELLAVVGGHSLTGLDHGPGQPQVFLEKGPLVHGQTVDGLSESLSFGSQTTKRHSNDSV